MKVLIISAIDNHSDVKCQIHVHIRNYATIGDNYVQLYRHTISILSEYKCRCDIRCKPLNSRCFPVSSDFNYFIQAVSTYQVALLVTYTCVCG